MDKGLIGMANSANISLSALRDGQRARVAALHLSGGMRRRVQDLGLVPGTRVTCVRRALGRPDRVPDTRRSGCPA